MLAEDKAQDELKSFMSAATTEEESAHNESFPAQTSPVSGLNSQEYDVFRKKFHVPRAWLSNPHLRSLFEHRYLTADARNVFLFISTTLRKLGYAGDNDMFVHDYLHHMLCDLLDHSNIPYITENDVRESPDLLKLFSRLTPDLIIKSGEGRPKPLVLDVYIGKNDDIIQEKKSKYKSLGVVFDVVGLTSGNMASVLKTVLPKNWIDYLFRQFQIFMTEYHYWRACLKVGKILFNDISNGKIVDLRIDQDVFFFQKMIFWHILK